MADHYAFTYNDIHRTIESSAEVLSREFRPDLIIAIGGGGYIPSRILRTFLRAAGKPNIPIQAIGLSLYEELGSHTSAEKLGKEVVRTQWLDFSALSSTRLLGKRILIVDEVDDSRTTLAYAVSELQKDVRDQLSKLAPEDRARFESHPTEFAVYVVHNKMRTKLGELPPDVRYFAGLNVPPNADGEAAWIDYPWEQRDILRHDEAAAKRPAIQNGA